MTISKRSQLCLVREGLALVETLCFFGSMLLALASPSATASESVPTDAPCIVALMNNLVTSGAFYGRSDALAYELALNVAGPPGPLLLVKNLKAPRPEDESAFSMYVLVRAESTCDELNVEFAALKTDMNGLLRLDLASPRKLSIRSRVNYRSEEGEFAYVPDLVTSITTDDQSSGKAENVTLSKGYRYQLASLYGRRECSEELDRMSTLICRALNVQPLSDCAAGVGGKTDPNVVRAKQWISDHPEQRGSVPVSAACSEGIEAQPPNAHGKYRQTQNR